jgi:hypothetical protein
MPQRKAELAVDVLLGELWIDSSMRRHLLIGNLVRIKFSGVVKEAHGVLESADDAIEILGIVLLDVAFETGCVITKLGCFLGIHLQTDRIDPIDQGIKQRMYVLVTLRLEPGKARRYPGCP